MAKRAAGSGRNTLPVGSVTGAIRWVGGAGAKKPAEVMLAQLPRVASPVASLVERAGAILKREHPADGRGDGRRMGWRPEIEQLVNSPDRWYHGPADGAVGSDTGRQLTSELCRERHVVLAGALERLTREQSLARPFRPEELGQCGDGVGNHAGPSRQASSPPATRVRAIRRRAGPIAAAPERSARRPPGPGHSAQRGDEAEDEPPRPRAQTGEPERAEQGEQQRLAQEQSAAPHLSVPARAAEPGRDQFTEDQPQEYGTPCPQQAAQGHRAVTRWPECCRGRSTGRES